MILLQTVDKSLWSVVLAQTVKQMLACVSVCVCVCADMFCTVFVNKWIIEIFA